MFLELFFSFYAEALTLSFELRPHRAVIVLKVLDTSDNSLSIDTDTVTRKKINIKINCNLTI